MVYKAHNLSTVSEVGRRLETEGLVAFGKRAYNQTDGNCFEIASRLIELFGYRPLTSRRELTDLILGKRAERLWSNSPSPRFGHKSPACLVVRTTDNLNDVHVAFEAYGREYNYGPGTKEGFPVEMRIPLYVQSG